MATQTPNYNLIKPDYTDPVDVKDLNDNSDIIDTTLAAKANLVGGKVPASELPSYVDDVIEGYYYNGAFYQDSAHTTAISGETGKIYIDLDTESCYRWSGSVYVKISSASDALYVEFTESSGVYSCDTGLADMYDALDEGREVIGVYDNSGVQEKYYVGNYSEAGDYVTFYSYNSTGKIAELFGTGSSSETWSYDEFSLTGGGGGQLPTATNLGDVPSWNPGTQLWEITHKGTITSGSTGYATGGDVYTAIGNIPQIPTGTNTGDILVWSGSAWVAQSTSRLPSEYQEVEWIGSSGTQRIETGYYNNVKRDIKFEGIMSFSDVTTRQLIGSQGGFYIGVVDGYIQAGLGGSNHSNIAVLANTFFDFSLSCFANTVGDGGENVMANVRSKDNTIHGNYASLSGQIAFTVSNDYQICLFAMNGQNLPATCKMGEFRLYIYNYLVRDLIPCYRIADGVIGMFDLVAGDFLTNAGTGTFTKGADV